MENDESRRKVEVNDTVTYQAIHIHYFPSTLDTTEVEDFAITLPLFHSRERSCFSVFLTSIVAREDNDTEVLTSRNTAKMEHNVTFISHYITIVLGEENEDVDGYILN